MLRRTLNLGILAHVDAGKTTLTERLLYAAGVIDEIGSVDDGSTQTDTLALERQRGITIKSAVVSFAIDDVTVNLIDTPGHPDFIAEVERVLSVLDGAVLVVSAVEGVQSQTPLLMRALQRLRVPTLLFVNKTDRRGADCERVAAGDLPKADDARWCRWHPRAARAFRERLAEVLAERDEAILMPTSTTRRIPYARLREELASQTKRALVHPVFFGSAITGAGVDALMSGIAELLPADEGDADAPASGTVFKIERGPAGERIAYVRMFSGVLRVRDRLPVGEDERKVTALGVFDNGSTVQSDSMVAGRSARSGASARSGSATRSASHTRTRSTTSPRRRWRRRSFRESRGEGRAPRRSHPAGGAGPADRPAPGRHPAGAVPLALRRGAEGGHPGDAGDRLRHRGRVPRDDDDLRRAARRHGRGGRDHRQGPNPFRATVGLRVEPGRSARA